MIKYIIFISLLFNSYATYFKFNNAGVYLNSIKCNLHSKINVNNIQTYQTEIQQTIGYICGLNNGVFILNNVNNISYSCASLPWPNVNMTNLFNHSPDKIIYYVNTIIEGFYNTSGFSPAACAGSITELTCNRENPWKNTPWYNKLNAPIKGVNIGGSFVLERWITPDFFDFEGNTDIIDQYTFSLYCFKYNKCMNIYDHWESFYNQDDFYNIKNSGINTVRLPVGFWYFAEISNVSSIYLIPRESIYDINHPITKYISYANNANLYVILDLHGAPGSQNGFDNSGKTTKDPQPDNWGQHWIYDDNHVNGTINTNIAMIKYIQYLQTEFNIDNILMIELLNEPWLGIDISLIKKYYVDSITQIRKLSNIPILFHDSFRGALWNTLLKDWPFTDVYIDTHTYYCFGTANVASNTLYQDQVKMYVHEVESCASSNFLHYDTCNSLPIVVGEWSMAIDDCMPYLNARFQNIGQCNRMNDRLNSTYWKQRYQSFAYKQMNIYEKELGWIFWTWKLSNYAETNELPSAYYWSLSLAINNGYIDLFDRNSIEKSCNYDPPYPNSTNTISEELYYVVDPPNNPYNNFIILCLIIISSALVGYAVIISIFNYCFFNRDEYMVIDRVEIDYQTYPVAQEYKSEI